MTTVKELIEFLQKQPEDMVVGYECFSEYRVLELVDIYRMISCTPRPDGWIHSKRPDKPTQEYLMFPGN